MAIHPHTHRPSPQKRWNINLFARWLEVRRTLCLLYYPPILAHDPSLVNHYFSGHLQKWDQLRIPQNRKNDT